MDCDNLVGLRSVYYDPEEVTMQELLSKREYVLKVIKFLKDADIYKHI